MVAVTVSCLRISDDSTSDETSRSTPEDLCLFPYLPSNALNPREYQALHHLRANGLHIMRLPGAPQPCLNSRFSHGTGLHTPTLLLAANTVTMSHLGITSKTPSK